MPENKKNKRKVLIDDSRSISGATGLPIQTSRTGEYDYEVITNIIKAAKDEGVDPYTALAIGLQETRFGEEGENVGQVNYGTLSKNKKRQQAYEEAIKNGKDDIYKGARGLAFMLKSSHEDADLAGYTSDKFDEAQRIQAYNGYGKIGANNDVGAKQLYGIDLTKNTIDMAKTPLYGKTIVDIRENVIRKNPEINELINGFSLQDDEISGLYIDLMPSVNGKTRYVFKKNGQVVGDIEDDAVQLETTAARSANLRSLYLKAKSKK